MMGRGWHGGGWDGGDWLLMMGIMVVFWGAVITAVVLFVRAPRGHGDEHAQAERGADPALAILNERFAKGEIDAEEYTKRRDTLRSG